MGMGSILCVLILSPDSWCQIGRIREHHLICTVESNQCLRNSHGSVHVVSRVMDNTMMSIDPYSSINFTNKIVIANIECFSAIVSLIELIWKTKRNNQFYLFR